MTPAGLERLKQDEDCILTAYPDPLSPLAQKCREMGIDPINYRSLDGWSGYQGEPWTCGYGATGAGISASTVWTQDQADADLLTKVSHIERQLGAVLLWFGAISPVRQDVLVNMAYNVGVSALLSWKHTLSCVDAGLYPQAAADILASKPWATQVGARAQRLATAMRTNSWG